MDTRSRRNQMADDDVLLQTLELVLAPRTAASVSTRVVSWKEAAEMKDSVVSDALVIPSRSGSLAGRLQAIGERVVFTVRNSVRSTFSPSRSAVSPASVTRTFCSI